MRDSFFDGFLAGMPEGLRKDVEMEIDHMLAQDVIAQERAALAVQVAERGMRRRSVNGIGGLSMQMSPALFHHAKRLGMNFMDRKDQRYLKNRYPEIAVKSGGTKEIMVGGAGAAASAKRSSKSYGN